MNPSIKQRPPVNPPVTDPVAKIVDLLAGIYDFLLRQTKPLTVYHNVSLSNTMLLVLDQPLLLYGWSIANVGSAASFIKLYDSPIAEPLASGKPPWLLLACRLNGDNTMSLSNPIPFYKGLSIAATGAATEGDASTPGGTVTISLWYR